MFLSPIVSKFILLTTISFTLFFFPLASSAENNQTCDSLEKQIRTLRKKIGSQNNLLERKKLKLAEVVIRRDSGDESNDLKNKESKLIKDCQKLIKRISNNTDKMDDYKETLNKQCT